MAERRIDSLRARVDEVRTGLRERRARGGGGRPAFVQRGAERWERTTIPRPRILGLLAGIVGLLVLLPLSYLVFGGTELGDDGPASIPYFEQ